jgi:DNA polymerase I
MSRVYDLQYGFDNSDSPLYVELLMKENGEKVRKQFKAPFNPYFYMEVGDFDNIPWGELDTSKTELWEQWTNPDYDNAPDGFVKVEAEAPGTIGSFRNELDDLRDDLADMPESDADIVPETYQADVPYARRVLIDRPDLLELDTPDPGDVLYFDIEVDPTDGFPEPDDADAQILSFAAVDGEGNEFFITGTEQEIYTELIGNPADRSDGGLLENYFVLVGWNSESFDLPYLKNRLEESDRVSGFTWPEFGLIHFDAMGLFRSFKRDQLDSYGLDSVAEHELGDSKDMDESESYKQLREWWNNDPERLKSYNLQDADLTRRISEQYLLVETTARVCKQGHTRMSTITYDSNGYPRVAVGKAVDGVILRRANEQGYVFPDRGRYRDTGEFPGGYVFETTPGTHEWVFVADFSSMYPSIIQALNMGENTWVDTDGYEGLKEEVGDYLDDREIITKPKLLDVNKTADGPGDYWANTAQPFIEGVNSRFDPEKDGDARGGFLHPDYERGILADATSDLEDLAQEFKDRRNAAENGTPEKKVAAAMYMGIKSLYNSSFGVVASPLHRYYVPGMSEHITETGQYLIRESRRFVENEIDAVDQVIGGDTDSVFISLKDDYDSAKVAADAAEAVVDSLNRHIKHLVGFKMNGDESFIELDVDYVASRFIQTDKKKSYAVKKVWEDGKATDEHKVVGLKCKKSDTLKGASKLQARLVEALLEDEPTAPIILDERDAVLDGDRDGDLVKRASLRKRLSCVCDRDECNCDTYSNHTAHARAAKMYNAAVEAGYIDGAKLGRGDKVPYIKFDTGRESVIHPVYRDEPLPWRAYKDGEIDTDYGAAQSVPGAGVDTFSFTPESRSYIWQNYFTKAIEQVNLNPNATNQAELLSFA